VHCAKTIRHRPVQAVERTRGFIPHLLQVEPGLGDVIAEAVSHLRHGLILMSKKRHHLFLQHMQIPVEGSHPFVGARNVLVPESSHLTT
jgi:hypothetical protein